jgi:hypothetical protein
MPYPKATSEQVYDGNRITLQDALFAQVMIPSSIKAEILPVAKKFMQFFYTDNSLVQFTKLTGTTIGMDYTVPQSVRDESSYYTNSFLDVFESDRTDYVYPSSNNALYLDNVSKFYENAWTSEITGVQKLHPMATLRESFSVKSIFDGYYAFRESSWTGFSKYF